MRGLESRKVFVDSGYFMFNTLKEVRNTDYYRNSTLPDDLFEDKKFVRLFERKFKGNLYRISKEFKIHFNHIVFVRDCPRGYIWRKSQFKEYKQHRRNTLQVDRNKFLNISNLFQHIYNTYIPSLKKKEKFRTIKIDELEADDIIAICSKFLEKKKVDTIIISEDNDFNQLQSNYIKIYNLRLEQRVTVNNTSQSNSILQKLLKGDRSDNIEPLENQENDMLKLLKELDTKKLCLHMKLMDYSKIPRKLKIEALNRFEELYS